MTHSSRLLAGAAIMLAAIGATGSLPALAQGAPQTVSLTKIDPTTLATGYRTSKLVGSAVLNESNETVGTIDDLIVTPTDQVPFAVLSVGGFLGLGTHYVVVSANTLSVIDKHVLLRGATKDTLKALPSFQYAY
jgi:sporulation protein YlmC with PRC-barrel domain